MLTNSSEYLHDWSTWVLKSCWLGKYQFSIKTDVISFLVSSTWEEKDKLTIVEAILMKLTPWTSLCAFGFLKCTYLNKFSKASKPINPVLTSYAQIFLTVPTNTTLSKKKNLSTVCSCKRCPYSPTPDILVPTCLHYIIDNCLFICFFKYINRLWHCIFNVKI